MKEERREVCNLIICDASGSMMDKIGEVRTGLYELFQDIKRHTDIKSRTIVVEFSGPEHFRELVNTKKVEKLTRELAESYQTYGCTALFDAIGKGFKLVGKKYDRVFVNILTDGYENASIQFDHKKISKLIRKKRKKGWAITFLGTSEEALAQARSIGIAAGNMALYADSPEGMRSASEMRSHAMHVCYSLASGIDDMADNLMGTFNDTAEPDEIQSNTKPIKTEEPHEAKMEF